MFCTLGEHAAIGSNLPQASPELPIHHHDVDLLGYVVEGHTYILDADEKRHEIGPGDKLVIPAGTGN